MSSSRDDGHSWLPWTMTFDRGSTGGERPAPFLLLVVADDVLLYSGARHSGSYPLLISEDHGASFHPPGQQALKAPLDQTAEALASVR